MYCMWLGQSTLYKPSLLTSLTRVQPWPQHIQPLSHFLPNNLLYYLCFLSTLSICICFRTSQRDRGSWAILVISVSSKAGFEYPNSLFLIQVSIYFSFLNIKVTAQMSGRQDNKSVALPVSLSLATLCVYVYEAQVSICLCLSVWLSTRNHTTHKHSASSAQPL